MKIAHIGIAVPNLQEALKFYKESLGMDAAGFETVEEQKATVAFVPCGESRLELLESTSPDGPIGKFVEKNKGRAGIHHIALEVDDIAAELERLNDSGVDLIDKTPRYGAGGAKIGFIHPKATGGLLLELCQEPEGHDRK
ncbi:methylmalonyl-CoA epimerase [Dethiosulfatibacter aminovorans DSM 17477]|uniref:Methylmalonyl-CoA epimerase n=1 Tax=Dethiosulfatibacter aminovorans DSM 17477 TaxID=1121476 RepID=A0A1M6MG68_9FIRM|nr:methylmalonyl-CoA epimerase [Dethiosulfatibacter aminovorans]SHJ82437.1 methylmalonyl-CoA epimerase [Dethiosulfatibacter aminovorans DSM 17477]